jgi:hypothetical protein
LPSNSEKEKIDIYSKLQYQSQIQSQSQSHLKIEQDNRFSFLKQLDGKMSFYIFILEKYSKIENYEIYKKLDTIEYYKIVIGKRIDCENKFKNE